jgi:hypothetical protein
MLFPKSVSALIGDGREALTINEFCALENISRSTFEKWPLNPSKETP